MKEKIGTFEGRLVKLEDAERPRSGMTDDEMAEIAKRLHRLDCRFTKVEVEHSKNIKRQRASTEAGLLIKLKELGEINFGQMVALRGDLGRLCMARSSMLRMRGCRTPTRPCRAKCRRSRKTCWR